MNSVKVRIYLFYVAAILFVAIGLWMIGGGLFGGGGFSSLVIGGLLFATGVVDYAMGSYLARLYLHPRPAVPDPSQAGDFSGAPSAASSGGPGREAGDGSGSGSGSGSGAGSSTR